MDTLGHLLALLVTPANEHFHACVKQERAQVSAVCERVQAATGQNVQVSFVDQGYTGDTAKAAAAEHGIELRVVKVEGAKRGFVLLAKRWVVERNFAWASRFRRLARDYERLPETLAGIHFVVFAGLMLAHLVRGPHARTSGSVRWTYHKMKEQVHNTLLVVYPVG